MNYLFVTRTEPYNETTCNELQVALKNTQTQIISLPLFSVKTIPTPLINPQATVIIASLHAIHALPKEAAVVVIGENLSNLLIQQGYSVIYTAPNAQSVDSYLANYPQTTPVIFLSGDSYTQDFTHPLYERITAYLTLPNNLIVPPYNESHWLVQSTQQGQRLLTILTHSNPEGYHYFLCQSFAIAKTMLANSPLTNAVIYYPTHLNFQVIESNTPPYAEIITYTDYLHKVIHYLRKKS